MKNLSKPNFKELFKLFTLSLFVAFVSCSKDNSSSSEFNSDYYINSTELAKKSKQDMQSELVNMGFGSSQMSLLINSGIIAHKIEYNTVGVNGEELICSGALVVPDVPDVPGSYPLVSLHHGTIFSNTEAPSEFKSGIANLAALLSSMGFIVSVPDYIGYGTSISEPHPYEHRQSLATASRDMLRASKEYIEQSVGAKANSKLFLAGYSEGGDATLSLFKLLQEEHSSEFEITGVSAGSGAYNKVKSMKYVFDIDEQTVHTYNFAWVWYTYNRIYSYLQRPNSYYLNSPWDEQIKDEYDILNLTGDGLNPQKLFKAEFIESVKNGTDTDFIKALEDNDIYDWKPDSPLRLTHGTNDKLVPYFNSVDAYNAMLSKGTTDVKLVTVDGGDHDTTIDKYLEETVMFFISMR